MEREARLGRREGDALIRLFQVDGSEAWVLVHIEIQAQPDPDFPLRTGSTTVFEGHSVTWTRKRPSRGHRDGRQEVARRMLSMGYTREQVQQATELSEQQLLALEKEQEPG